MGNSGVGLRQIRPRTHFEFFYLELGDFGVSWRDCGEERGWVDVGIRAVKEGQKKKNEVGREGTCSGLGVGRRVVEAASVPAMLSSMLEASRRRRQRRTWKHGAIKYVALGAIMLFLCLLYAKQGEDLVGQSDSSISSFVSTSTFRTTFAEPESQEGEAEDDGGGCDRYERTA